MKISDSDKFKIFKKFQNQILYGSLVKLLSEMTGTELSSDKIDVKSFDAEKDNIPLSHDYDIPGENQLGRRIAFIYYLVEPEWEVSNEENLELFNINRKEFNFLFYLLNLIFGLFFSKTSSD